MRIKVLHIITDLSTGGAEMVLYNLLKGGLKERFDNYIVSLRDVGTIGLWIRKLDIPVEILDMRNRLPSIHAIKKLNNIVKRFNPEVIHGWMYHGNLAALASRMFAPTKPSIVWGIRQSLYDLKKEKIMTRQVIRANRFFSGLPAAILYNSRVSKKHHETFGFSPRRSQVIPNGIDIQRVKFSRDARQEIRAELGIPQDALVIGHVARFHPMKDHKTFLKAIARLILDYKKLHVLLCGNSVTWENKAIANLIPAEARDRFHLLGERSDVPDLMSAMDIFCLSSWAEAFPNVLGEAMACGVPCVTTDVGDSMDIVGDTGVVVPPKDSEVLVEGLRKLIEMEPSQRQLLGRAARKRIEENFSLSTMVKRYVEMYEEIVKSSKLKAES